MAWTPPPLPTCFAERLALILAGLCRAIAERGPKAGAAAPLIGPARTRVRRLSARFLALVAAFRAGRLGGPKSPGGPEARKERAQASDPVADSQPARSGVSNARPPEGPKPPSLPCGFGWMLRFGSEVACHGSQFEHWLTTDPEVAALLKDAPQAGRILRPLCHMLGIEPPPELRLPPRERQTRAVARAASGRRAASGSRPPEAASRPPEWRRPVSLWSSISAGADPPPLAFPSKA